jgi:hypothetical protein
MSGYFPIGVGAYSSLPAGGGNLTPPLPSYSPGLWVLETDVNGIAFTPPTISGWSRASPNNNAQCAALYLRIAQPADTAPVFQWDTTHQALARISLWGGDVYQDLSTIVVASNDRGASTPGALAVNATSAPAQSNCLVLRGGHCVKTVANNGSTFGDWFVDSNVYTKLGNTELVQNNNALASALWYWQQTAPSMTDADTASLTNNDAAGTSQGYTVVLRSQPSGFIPPQPVLSKRRQFFVDETLVLIP